MVRQSLLSLKEVNAEPYRVPWVLEYDDSACVLEAQNMSLETLVAVQLFAADPSFNFSTLPQKVGPGDILAAGLGLAVKEMQAQGEAFFYLRWTDASGARLLWPVPW